MLARPDGWSVGFVQRALVTNSHTGGWRLFRQNRALTGNSGGTHSVTANLGYLQVVIHGNSSDRTEIRRCAKQVSRFHAQINVEMACQAGLVVVEGAEDRYSGPEGRSAPNRDA